VKIAKTDRAKLNNFKKALDDKRKDIKKQCLEPYEKFESQIKEILSLVDEPITEIDNQVKAFEQKTKDIKMEDIKALYKEIIGDLETVVKFEKIYNPKWMNVTYKLGTISEELVTITENVKRDLQQIEDLKSEYELEMKNKYLDTLLITEALAVKTRLEAQKKNLEELKAKEEAKKPVEAKVVNPVQRVEPNFEPMKQDVAPAQQEELQEIAFRLWVTEEQKQFLRNWILTNNIKAGKV
jgi:predicted nuclease with TOPRIM domain